MLLLFGRVYRIRRLQKGDLFAERLRARGAAVSDRGHCEGMAFPEPLVVENGEIVVCAWLCFVGSDATRYLKSHHVGRWAVQSGRNGRFRSQIEQDDAQDAHCPVKDPERDGNPEQGVVLAVEDGYVTFGEATELVFSRSSVFLFPFRLLCRATRTQAW